MNLSKSTCRNFAIGGIICAGISIVIGGALLDIVGFVIGFIALTSAKKMIAAMPGDAYVENVLKLAKIAVVVSLVAIHREHFDRRFPDARSGRPSEQHGSQVRIHVLGNRSKA